MHTNSSQRVLLLIVLIVGSLAAKRAVQSITESVIPIANHTEARASSIIILLSRKSIYSTF